MPREQEIAAPEVPGDGTSTPAVGRTRALLAAGAVGPPLWLTVVLMQTVTRDGYDPVRHAASQLSTGDLGWIQIANFVLVGLMSLAGAAGLRRVLSQGPASRWGPILFAAFGVSMVWAGVFVTDPYRGFPPGSAEPDEATWHALLHNIAPVIAFTALFAACLVFARRYLRHKQRAWAGYSVASAVVALALTSAAQPADDFRFMFAGMAIIMIWSAVIAAKTMAADTGR